MLVAAERLSDVEAVVTIGAPSHPDHVTHLLADRVDAIRRLVEIADRCPVHRTLTGEVVIETMQA